MPGNKIFYSYFFTCKPQKMQFSMFNAFQLHVQNEWKYEYFSAKFTKCHWNFFYKMIGKMNKIFLYI